MAGGKRSKRKRKLQQPQLSSSISTAHSSKSNQSFPLAFPPNLSHPHNAFLRDIPPHRQSFQRALETSYEGFVVDEPTVFDNKSVKIEQALREMEAAGFFRVDVTQPFGLGTKCAKTYVTRCLVGEPGTTYKYLGLRMFAHSWNVPKGPLSVVGELNQYLTDRAKNHLSCLDQTRKERGAAPTKGRLGFDIALINRMESPKGLKDEPSMGEGKCSVSWHADSSLQHYSTIAVYHLLSKESDKQGQWSVGLRVAHNSEGPGASRRGTDIGVESKTPPLAVSLASGAAYYLLDDFNHHHQHAVIADGKVPGRRFSSTHRLLRESHNVAHILARAKAVCGTFHKKGAKVWRSEQLLLTEMESEWLRQFYIQGTTHYNLLWSNWKESIEELLKYWSLLEERTKQTLDWLQICAETKCDDDQTALSRSKRKLREKQRKASHGIQDLLKRGGGYGNALEELYHPVAVLLEERANMRELWFQREQDVVFDEVDPDERPMSIPFDFEKQGKRPADRGFSPMPSSHEALREMARQLRARGKAYESVSKACFREVDNHVSNGQDYAESLAWDGWKTLQFGLEMQDPWAGHLLTGLKSVETRAYPLPPDLIGRRIEILQSCKGTARVSSLGNTIDLVDDNVKQVGWCKFGSVIEYRNGGSFRADEAKHLVDSGSEYSWKEGGTEVIYGWVVTDFGTGEEKSRYRLATRRMRSLFELRPTMKCDQTKIQATIPATKKRPKKKKRY